jgi:hypothetical protein
MPCVPHGGGQRVEVVRAEVATSVDEERRGPGDPVAVASLDVTGYPQGVPSAVEVVGEPLNVQSELPRVVPQVIEGQGVLVLVEEVVHLSESPLASAASAARVACSWTSGRGRWRKTKVLAAYPDELSDHRLGLAAVGTFKVGVLHQGDVSVGGAAHVIDVGVYRLNEVDQGRRNEARAGDRQAAGRVISDSENEPREHGRQERRGEYPELGVLEFLPVEGDVGDEERDGEADTGDGGGADQRRPGQR